MALYTALGKWYTSPERKVYFADTDAAGVMHHSQYLRYFEAGRIDFLDDIGCTYLSFQQESVGFVPVNINISYKTPLVYGDIFAIKTCVSSVQRVSFTIESEIISEKAVHAVATVKLASMNEGDWKLIPLPKRLLESLQRFEQGQ